jgi:hypothetical protein
VDEFGRNTPIEVLGPPEFQRLQSVFAKRVGPVRLGNQIGRVRTLFKWAFDSELIDKPVRTGPDFRKPARHVIRKVRASANGGIRDCPACFPLSGHLATNLLHAWESNANAGWIKRL